MSADLQSRTNPVLENEAIGVRAIKPAAISELRRKEQTAELR